MFHGKIEKMCNRNVMAMEIDFEADAFDEGRHLMLYGGIKDFLPLYGNG